MTLTFGSPKANDIRAADKLAEKVRAQSGQRLDAIEKELYVLADEIEWIESELSDFKRRRRDLLNEQRKLEKGEPG